MTAQELRIGNYYDHNGQVKTVTSDVIQEVWIAERLWCKPEPLTEDWLIKFGFSMDPSLNPEIKCYWNLRTFSIEQFPDGSFHFCANDYHLIQYVHTLQNLVHALTGSELTIKE